MIDWRFDALGPLATISKRALLRLEIVFFAIVDFAACGALTAARLAADLAVAALAAGPARAADKASNPAIFKAKFKMLLDMVDFACLNCYKKNC